MFSSKEIRWFTKTENKAISGWFSQQGYEFGSVGERRDYYLPYPDNKVGFKLREGNIELKHQTAPPEKKQLLASVIGYLETYVKWSFSTASDDTLSSRIINEKAYDWIEVKKERMGIKVRNSEGPLTRWVDINEEIPFGCQVEYTRITINQDTWFSFGLEWFGDKVVALDPGFLNDILGKTQLRMPQSMGYAEFLLKYFHRDQN